MTASYNAHLTSERKRTKEYEKERCTRKNNNQYIDVITPFPLEKKICMYTYFFLFQQEKKSPRDTEIEAYEVR
jgi:hypothetical protein